MIINGIIIALLIVILIILIIVLCVKDKKQNLNNTQIMKDIENNLVKYFNDKIKNQTDMFEILNNKMFEKIELILNNMEKDITILQSNYQKNQEFISNKLEQLNKNNNDANEKINVRLSIEIKEFNAQVKETLKEFNISLKESLLELKNTINHNLDDIRKDNNDKLERINLAVNEKLEKTLEGKLKQSFDNVIEQIGGVNKAIGEIKGLATDVGSLKTVLTNVKTKGIVGEVILGNIIRDILTSSQYEENVVTKIGSCERVEFAIKMPISVEENIMLPIDSKLPLESYHKIKEGIDSGDKNLIKEQRKLLRDAIKKYAKDIKDKYIDVPNTTEFGILFLPIEGLYIEALDMGLFEELYHEYKIYLAGPTTLAAILNALQISFKSIAIQKKSSDVFKLLEAVKTEFNKFATSLKKTQQKLGVASKELDDLVGTRTRQMQKKLSNIDNIDYENMSNILDFDEEIE